MQSSLDLRYILLQKLSSGQRCLTCSSMLGSGTMMKILIVPNEDESTVSDNTFGDDGAADTHDISKNDLIVKCAEAVLTESVDADTAGNVDEADSADEVDSADETEETEGSSDTTSTEDDEEREDIPKEYFIHKSLLVRISPYFRALDNFKEGQDNAVVLKDVNLPAFAIFVHWLYTNQLRSGKIYEHIDTLIAAYGFADRILSPSFKNFIVDRIRGFEHGCCATPATLLKLQRMGFTEAEGIMRYFVDSIAWWVAGNEQNTMRLETMPENDRAFFQDGGDLVMVLTDRILDIVAFFDRHRWADLYNTRPSANPLINYHEPRTDDDWCIADRVTRWLAKSLPEW